jgi:DNA-binding NarL/FixJ family response regulator
MQWWTRSQRIRTAAELPLVVSLVDRSSLPLHAQIAPRARVLAALGLPNVQIAAELGVSDKTVAKALAS